MNMRSLETYLSALGPLPMFNMAHRYQVAVPEDVFAERAAIVSKMSAITGRLEKLGMTAEREGRKFTDAEDRRANPLFADYDGLKHELAALDAEHGITKNCEVVAEEEAGPSLGRQTDPESIGSVVGRVAANDNRPAVVKRQGPVFAFADGQEIRALLPDEQLADRSPSKDRAASFGKFMRGVVTGNWDGASAEFRAASEGSGSAGGFLLPETISRDLIDLARNQSVLIRGGMLTLTMPTPEMRIVRQTSDVTGAWRGEHIAIDESEPQFEPLTLRAVTLAAMTRVSIELIEDSPAFGGIIESSIAAALALELDRVGVFGTGVGEPLGIVNTDGIGEVSMGVNGAAFTNYDPFLDGIELVDIANGTAGAVAYSPRTKRALAGLKTGLSNDNTPLMPPADFTNLMRLSSNQFPTDETQGSSTNASTALLGDYSQAVFGIRSGLRVEATRLGDTSAFSQLEVLIRGYLRADIAVLRPAHFVKITGIIPA